MRCHRFASHALGPGGIKCPCCRPRRCNLRDAKRLSNRLVRYALKRLLRKEMEDGAHVPQ
jgi:hypothetical protein